jgi:hypothetical protein
MNAETSCGGEIDWNSIAVGQAGCFVLVDFDSSTSLPTLQSFLTAHLANCLIRKHSPSIRLESFR